MYPSPKCLALWSSPISGRRKRHRGVISNQQVQKSAVPWILMIKFAFCRCAAIFATLMKDRLQHAIRAAQRIVVLTGAGVRY
jgi:hypothetical protein